MVVSSVGVAGAFVVGRPEEGFLEVEKRLVGKGLGVR